MLNKSLDLLEIESATKQRYSKRYHDLGNDVKTLGWGSSEQQDYRFQQTLDFDFTAKTVLDIGCGFGDYLTFLKNNKVPIKRYIGLDINQDLVSQALENHPNATFKVASIIDINENNLADAGVMLGVLNLNLKAKMDNLAYSKLFISKAFEMVNEVLIVDFLSTHMTKNYKKEDFVYYHDPLEMLKFAFTLSNNVVLKHDYSPIPQKEFMLFIYKENHESF